ncbi:MAG: GNAT family N-acetyltransferase [Pseudomonadota bacterium]|nr:GNAT family N-acetyltransferase [Pseudomonadota bacterium]
MRPDIRHAPLDPNDWPDLARVLGSCFGIPAEKWDSFRSRLGDDNLRVAHVGGQVAGGLGIYRMGQVFGGRSVPLGGLAGVGIAAEHRGAGVAGAMVGDTLRALRDDGVPLAGLYASTQRLYRSIGFEQAGNRVAWKVGLRAIDVLDRTLPVTRVEGADALRPLYHPTHGNLDRSAAIWERITRPRGAESWCYRVGDEGYAVLGTEPSGVSDFHFHVLVRDWQAHTPAAARRLWTLLADHSSLGTEARWFGAASDPRIAHLSEQAAEIIGLQRWMIRILDVAGALTARGWPAHVSGELHLDIDDPLFSENAGRWVVEVAEGRAHVARGGSGSLKLGIRGLAPLYTGFYDPGVLAELGWVQGDAATLRTAARLFASPEPWMSEMY